MPKYGQNLAAPRDKRIFKDTRIILQRIIQKDPDRLLGCVIDENMICNTDVLTITQYFG